MSDSTIDKVEDDRLPDRKPPEDCGGYMMHFEVQDYGAGPINMDLARTYEGHYIGEQDVADLLMKHGVSPMLRDGVDNVCTIGWSHKLQKWAGWSHRGIAVFAIGDVVKEGDVVAKNGWTDEYMAKHPEKDLRFEVGFKAATHADCRRLAEAYADGVS